MAASWLFCEAPQLEFSSARSHCLVCRQVLKVHKSHNRAVSTLHIGRFHAKETILACPKRVRAYRSEELGQLAPPGANFGYDVLAQTPLVRNLQNPTYMKLLLAGKATLEEVFAQIEIDTLRKEFRKAQLDPEQIPAVLKTLIAMPDYPQRLIAIVEKTAA